MNSAIFNSAKRIQQFLIQQNKFSNFNSSIIYGMIKKGKYEGACNQSLPSHSELQLLKYIRLISYSEVKVSKRAKVRVDDETTRRREQKQLIIKI